MSARDRRGQRNEAPASTLSREQHAFAQGKRAGEYYARKLADGLRPLDTARRLP